MEYHRQNYNARKDKAHDYNPVRRANLRKIPALWGWRGNLSGKRRRAQTVRRCLRRIDIGGGKNKDKRDKEQGNSKNMRGFHGGLDSYFIMMRFEFWNQVADCHRWNLQTLPSIAD